jgi:type II secretory pathway pseudopilin PulG
LRFPCTNSRLRRGSDRTAEGGYILLVLLLFVALLTIAAAAIAPSIAFQVRRDREEEMIHRGVQYSRAVRHYYKKFNRYPSKIEDLEDTNNYRSLRKRYKDPITGADFKVLHLSEVQMALGGGAVGGLTPPGTNPGAGANGQFGQSASAFGSGNFGGAATPPGAQSASTDGTDVASPSGQSAFGSTGAGGKQPGGSSSNTSGDKLAGQTFGGGPIAGVVSTSKAQSIREFNKKDHYNQWLFIYDPNSDRGGLLSTPSQPPLQGAGGLPGMPGAPGTSGSGSGNQGLGNQGTPGMQAPQSPPQEQPQQQ